MKLTEFSPQKKGAVLKKLWKDVSLNRVDTPLVPLLIELNLIPGVCTIGCCIGHMVRSPHYIFPFEERATGPKGYLALWLREDKEKAFESIISALLQKCLPVKINFCQSTFVGKDEHGKSLMRISGKTASIYEPVSKDMVALPERYEGRYKTYEVWWDYNMFWYFKEEAFRIIKKVLT